VILGRRSPVSDEPDLEVVDTEPELAQPSGKGRPTPKRAQAQKARRSSTPKDRKEAAKMRRQKDRDQRRLAREALVGGDERNLPASHAGPQRRLVRDVVDAHFTYGEVFFAVILAVLVLSLLPSPAIKAFANALGLLSLLVMAVDAVRVSRRVKRVVSERYGDAATRGMSFYAVSRALLPRRFRRPPPQVARGDKV
jgi:hypothetical protein